MRRRLYIAAAGAALGWCIGVLWHLSAWAGRPLFEFLDAWPLYLAWIPLYILLTAVLQPLLAEWRHEWLWPRGTIGAPRWVAWAVAASFWFALGSATIWLLIHWSAMAERGGVAAVDAAVLGSAFVIAVYAIPTGVLWAAARRGA